MKIIIFISIVCLSSLEASSFSLSTQKSTETTSVSGSEKCSADDFVNGIEKLKQISELKKFDELKKLDKMSHDFQEKDYNIWHKPADLFQIHSNLTSILEQQFDGYNNADSERPYFDDACDAVIQFFKCIINKEIDALQDDSSDVLEPEQSKNLTAVQNDINSLADDFNNDENELTEDDLSDELKRNQKKVQKIGLSLCPKKRETENRSDKMKINRAVSHLNDVIFDFTYYYGFLTKYNAYKQRKQVPAWEYPFLSIKCSNHSK